MRMRGLRVRVPWGGIVIVLHERGQFTCLDMSLLTCYFLHHLDGVGGLWARWTVWFWFFFLG